MCTFQGNGTDEAHLQGFTLASSSSFLSPPPTVAVSYRPSWPTFMQPKSPCFRGKRPAVGHLVSRCFSWCFHVPVFVSRVILSLQKQLVTADFTPEFRQKIQDFYTRLLFPAELKSFKNRYGSVFPHHHLGNRLKL